MMKAFTGKTSAAVLIILLFAICGAGFHRERDHTPDSPDSLAAGQNESNSMLWYDLGEFWLKEKEFTKARQSYEKALMYAEAAGDSLLCANALKGFGRLYMETRRSGKAFQYFLKAEDYYKDHSKGEAGYRIENLELIHRALSRQNKQIMVISISAASLLVLLSVLLLFHYLRNSQRKKKENARDVFNGVLSDLHPGIPESGIIPQAPESVHSPPLTVREKEILLLIAKGYTSGQIADKLFLSLPTIKWYRKKLLVKFDSANTAEMIHKAKDAGFI